MSDLPPPAPLYSFNGPNLSLNLHHHGMLAIVSNDGEIRINWTLVETAAADPQSEITTLNYARLLLAARDGTAKPLSDDAH